MIEKGGSMNLIIPEGRVFDAVNHPPSKHYPYMDGFLPVTTTEELLAAALQLPKAYSQCELDLATTCNLRDDLNRITRESPVGLFARATVGFFSFFWPAANPMFRDRAGSHGANYSYSNRPEVDRLNDQLQHQENGWENLYNLGWQFSALLAANNMNPRIVASVTSATASWSRLVVH